VADELDPVTQQFYADFQRYVEPMADAVKEGKRFAKENRELSNQIRQLTEVVKQIRDALVEDSQALGETASDTRELRDATTETAEALGHERDEATETAEEIKRVRDESLEAKETQDQMRDASIEAGEALGHVRDEALEAAESVKEMGDQAEQAAAKLDLMGLSGLGLFGPLLGMLAAMVVAVAAVAPAVVAMGLGFAAFGAFAIPTLKTIFGAIGDTKAQLDKLPAPIRMVVGEVKNLEGEWKGLSKAFQLPVVQMLSQLLGVASDLLPKVIPLAQAGAKAMSGLVTAISTGLESKGFSDFLSTMTRLVVPATQAITHLAGALLGILGHALTSLAPLSAPFINMVAMLVKALSGPLVAALHGVVMLFVGVGKALTPILPVLSAIASAILNDMASSFAEFLPVLDKVVAALAKFLIPTFKALAPVIENALTPNSPFMTALSIMADVLARVLPLLGKLIGLLITPGIARMAVDIISLVIAFKALMGIIALVRGAMALLTAVMDVNPFFLIITVIALLVVAFIELWDHCKGFRDFWKDAWRIIEDAAMSAWHFIDSTFHELMNAATDVVDWIRSHWRMLAIILLGPMAPVAALVIFIVEHWNTIRSATAHLVSDVANFFSSLPGKIASVLGHLASILYSIGENAIMGLVHGIENMAGSVLGAVGHIASLIPSGLSKILSILSPSQVMYAKGQYIVLGLVHGILSGAGLVTSAMNHIAGLVKGATATVGIATGSGTPAAAAAGSSSAGTQLLSTNVIVQLDGKRIAANQRMQSRVFNRRNLTTSYTLRTR